jgi:hypothetical protein
MSRLYRYEKKYTATTANVIYRATHVWYAAVILIITNRMLQGVHVALPVHAFFVSVELGEEPDISLAVRLDMMLFITLV